MAYLGIGTPFVRGAAPSWADTPAAIMKPPSLLQSWALSPGIGWTFTFVHNYEIVAEIKCTLCPI